MIRNEIINKAYSVNVLYMDAIAYCDKHRIDYELIEKTRTYILDQINTDTSKQPKTICLLH